MIGILHGYLLEGSGSNIWTRSIVKSLCENGETVHLVCQENHPENFDFIAECHCYYDNSVSTTLERNVPYTGKCIMHKPMLGKILPVYVWDKYEEFSNVIPMIDLSDSAIEDYLTINTKVVLKVISDYGITALHANHAVLMSVVAKQVKEITSVPFAVMPHGSAIEYAVKKDKRFLNLANQAFGSADKIFVVSEEMENRVASIFQSIPNIKQKMTRLNLGVNTTLFKPIPPELRSNNIKQLCRKLKNVPRGKDDVKYTYLKKNLSSKLQHEEFNQILSSITDYENKRPDFDVEEKLERVDWNNDKIILFVGRLIASKGIQSIVFALPWIMYRHPETRLIIVGHGPLREIMESLLWALENNDKELVEKLISWGQFTEANPDKTNSFEEVLSFYKQLEERNELNSYFDIASKYIRRKKIIFTGYLKHEELRYLFPCCDLAIFPSVVMEAGPLVFLESLASGCFPMGTYFGGMATSIDSISDRMSSEDADLMKIGIGKDEMIFDIIEKTNTA
ncbi:MAG: glycosyltransferase, partial [Nitrosopumilus sp.]|nr:glycosyltransferase [Nitrosopumilus sp.]